MVTALASSAVVSRMRLAVSLVNGLSASTLLAMPKPTVCAVGFCAVAFENSLTMKGQNFAKVSSFLGWDSYSQMAGLKVPVHFMAVLKRAKQ